MIFNLNFKSPVFEFTMLPEDHLICAVGSNWAGSLKLQILPIASSNPQVWFDFESVNIISDNYVIVQGFNTRARLLLVGAAANTVVQGSINTCPH